MRRFRNHGINTDSHQRSSIGTWYYEVVDFGLNYRITDFQCALGLSQLRKVEQWIKRRQDIARQYDFAFNSIEDITPLSVNNNIRHAYHLYVVKLKCRGDLQRRPELFTALREKGVGVNVHYIPLNLHPYYQQHLDVSKGQCPVAETAYENILSLPIFPAMKDKDVEYVIKTIFKLVTPVR